MKRKLAVAGHSGFTLLEILLAISIFSTAALAVFWSYRSVLLAGSTLQHERSICDLATRCMAVIADDLERIHVTPNTLYRQRTLESAPDPYRVVGDGQAARRNGMALLRFVSMGRLRVVGNSLPGLAEIQYFVEDDSGGDRVLRRSQRFVLGTKGEPFYTPRICRNVAEIQLRFIDGNGKVHDHWDSDSKDFGFATPDAIGVTLVLAEDGRTYRLNRHMPLPVLRRMKS
jgi:general secretion pathway protein J